MVEYACVGVRVSVYIRLCFVAFFKFFTYLGCNYFKAKSRVAMYVHSAFKNNSILLEITNSVHNYRSKIYTYEVGKFIYPPLHNSNGKFPLLHNYEMSLSMSANTTELVERKGGTYSRNFYVLHNHCNR